jgi:DNA-binding transcriptional regulator GbsR (MarR family)
MSPDQELEQLLKILIDRFGAKRSLGEIYATTYAFRVAREGRIVSLSEVSEYTGISMKNLSRWARDAVQRDLLKVRERPDDRRVKDFAAVDFAESCRHLPAVAAVFGVEVDPSWMDRVPRGNPSASCR